ncbi:MAG: hypothetical protein PHW18_12265 [Sulfuricurvum sp.]|uniref:hypothetical protein n=1 Tax=Sulfuricurvum sp. TaxID=2025608 RepID=UPI002609A599|nr:hypothetical protein [Sulfuricurvum sp.]MDD2830340.1 hypothetical protein [Sulfuricurvum sp.]MDD4950789.1 hypothetical protein [Sulfuricurvum sp.]
MKLIEKKYYSIYLVITIILICFIFMIISTFIIYKNIGEGKTSLDIAIQQSKEKCNEKNGKIVIQNKNNPLNSKCVIDTKNVSK